MSQIEGMDLSQLPQGMDMSQIPGMNMQQIPQVNNIPQMQLPQGMDMSQIPQGVDLSQMGVPQMGVPQNVLQNLQIPQAGGNADSKYTLEKDQKKEDFFF